MAVHVTAQERMWRRCKPSTRHFGPSAGAYEGGTATPAAHKRMLSVVKCAAPEVLASELEPRIPSSKLCAPSGHSFSPQTEDYGPEAEMFLLACFIL